MRTSSHAQRACDNFCGFDNVSLVSVPCSSLTDFGFVVLEKVFENVFSILIGQVLVVLSPIQRVVNNEVSIVLFDCAQAFVVLRSQTKQLLKVFIEIDFMTILVLPNKPIQRNALNDRVQVLVRRRTYKNFSTLMVREEH